MRSNIVHAIAASGLSIYDPLDYRRDLFIETSTLERILNKKLVGLELNFPIRTRSKVLKEAVCQALGYPVPKSFRRCKPRFPGQNFDTYVQKSNNLQIWNEEIIASRRYVLIRVNANQIVNKVRVVTGEVIAKYDKTGTLTHKYQARSRKAVKSSRLFSVSDTSNVRRLIQKPSKHSFQFIPIKVLYTLLIGLVGTILANPGKDQERNRGGILHELVYKKLGKSPWSDTGQFPDIPDQLLEIKLQTAPTIDLGLVCPDSKDKIADFPEFRHCDVRYSVFYGTCLGSKIRLDHLILTTGADFFNFFRRFEGKIKNAKIQIPLPANFFA
jgi:hypothetical protein